MVELLQNTSNLKKVQDKETRFLLTYFVLVLEIVFIYVKENKNIKGISILIFCLCR